MAGIGWIRLASEKSQIKEKFKLLPVMTCINISVWVDWKKKETCVGGLSSYANELPEW